jgi:hypothetical protein
VQQCATVHAAVCGSAACGTVRLSGSARCSARQSGSAAAFGSVQQCAAVRTDVCGSARMCAAVHVVVCGSACGSVGQCARQCSAVRQCAGVYEECLQRRCGAGGGSLQACLVHEPVQPAVYDIIRRDRLQERAGHNI